MVVLWFLSFLFKPIRSQCIICYALKTSEKCKFSDVSGIEEEYIGNKWVNEKCCSNQDERGQHCLLQTQNFDFN